MTEGGTSAIAAALEAVRYVSERKRVKTCRTLFGVGMGIA